ncbi:hypothetical protein HB364_30175 [Pseudoflavitalea sp. X16]|uniref:hypothetical protein n=1 Tax=Paraflavitalea devenefica TaxID=2716334 RepID=UPI0014231E2F|nr:hypothetical protein [Paraflavitalea devenefica]NII29386.1 hypothetical protein [Paraflavitalea devenefica]
MLAVISPYTGYSQENAVWKDYKVDHVVTLTLPVKIDTSTVYERCTIGQFEYENLAFIYSKIDVIDSVPWPRDTLSIRNGYDKLIKGFLSQNPGTVLEKREIVEGQVFGVYAKMKATVSGADAIVNLKAFFINGDTYGIMTLTEAGLAEKTKDVSEKLMRSIKISPLAKQFQHDNPLN